MNIGHSVEKAVKFLEIKDRNSVLDLGAGTGVFSKEFIKVTKNVTALDRNDIYFKKLEKLGIKTVKADICEYCDGNYDLIFIANVYHHVRNICNEKLFENLNKMAKKYVAVIDFNPKGTIFGPPKSMRIPKEKTIEEFEHHNFKIVKEMSFSSRYLILFERK